MLKIIGKHITVDMYGCSYDILDNPEFIKQAMLTAIKDANMTLISFSSHKFEPQGLTALALLAESHLSIHTYPEIGYAAIDVFTCGDHSRPDKAVNSLRHLLNPEKTKTTHIRRGDFGSVSDMKPKTKVHMTAMRRVRNTGEKVLRLLYRNR